MFYFYNKLIYLFDSLFLFFEKVLISYVILEMLSRKPSRGVREWFGAKQNAYSRENIFNYRVPKDMQSRIKHNFGEHLNFKTFVGKVIDEVSADLDNDVGEIITVHSVNTNTPEDNEYLEYLHKLYSKDYLDGLPETNPKNKDGNIYPRFDEDLFARNDLQYKKFEEQHKIPVPLEKQTDEQFYQSLKDRVSGLYKCMNDPKESDERKEYYTKEYEREKKIVDELETAKSDSSVQKKISEVCKNIYWNKETQNRSPNTFNYEEFEKFLNANDKLELKVLRTFMPDEYFNLDANGNTVSIKMNLVRDK